MHFGWQWTINGKAFPRMPMYMLRAGETVEFSFSNHSHVAHPMHLHGHHMLVFARDGRRVTPWWSDTLEIGQGERYDVAVDRREPGRLDVPLPQPAARRARPRHARRLRGRDDAVPDGTRQRQRARMKLEVVEGDIAALEVDAVANAANDHLWMGAGVAGALKRAGGEEIEREAVGEGADSGRRGRRDGRRPAAGAVGDPRRGDGTGPAHERRARRAARREACCASRTSSAPSRSRCRPSAPASAGFRSTSARG